MNTQRGAVLIVSLVLMMVLTLLASASMQNATLQEKMAGSQARRDASFQAAESVLRRAEGHLRTPGFSPTPCLTPDMCLPPRDALTFPAADASGGSGMKWEASSDGFFAIQLLGETDGPAGGGASDQPHMLYRVTVIGLQGGARTVLESIHTAEKRIMWRQRQ